MVEPPKDPETPAEAFDRYLDQVDLSERYRHPGKSRRSRRSSRQQRIVTGAFAALAIALVALSVLPMMWWTAKAMGWW